MHGPFAALSIRSFAILWTGSLGSTTGFFMSTIVQAIVAFELTGRNGAVGLVLLGSGVASIVLGPLGGAVADRFPKKTVTLIAQTASMAVFIVTGLLILTDRLVLFHLVAGAFLNGVTFAFLGPTRQAWVLELVGEELRANAIALSQVAFNASRIWAPAAAGAMVATVAIGAAGAYFAMAGLYVLSLISLALLPGAPARSDATRQSIAGDLVAGVRYAWSEPRLRGMLAFFFVIIMLGLSSTTVLPGLVENELGREAEAFGLLQTVNAVGGLAASILVASMAGSPRALAVYSAGAALGGVSLILTGLAPGFYTAFVPLFLSGVGIGAFQTLNSAIVAVEADPAYFGRITSLTFLAFAGFLIASYPVGLVADVIGERAILIVLGLLSIVAVAVLAPAIARAPAIGLARRTAGPGETATPSPRPVGR